MFADPQSVTVAGTPHSLPRVSSSGTSAVYQKSDENWKLSISHQKQNGKIRTVARIDQRAVVADPLTAVNDFEILTTYIVIERPIVGFSSTNVNDQIAGFKTWLDSTNVGKLFGQES